VQSALFAKARVERGVATVRDDCFAGEQLQELPQARARAVQWCTEEYGFRRHTRTGRLPREHFEAEEQPALGAAPTTPYDIPLWTEPKVARDHHAQVARALYSLPTAFVGKRLVARADRHTVRFYHAGQVVKVHVRQAPGGRATDPADFPVHQTAYALRDITFLQQEATRHGAAIGQFAAALLAVPLPWTRMRRVYALLGLVRRYGVECLERECAQALRYELLDVRRLERIIRLGLDPPAPPNTTPPVPPARHANGVRLLVPGDSVLAGADDNASVSAAEFAAARAFVARRPKRSLLFVHHGSEERGLLGSRYHSAHPVVPLAQIVAVLNGDMIGRNHPDTATLLGAQPPHRNSSELVELALQANAATGRFVVDTLWDRPTHSEGWYFRSDHLPYARLGVPAIMYSTNLHGDYHTAGDIPERIDYAKLTRMARWMYLTGWYLANAPKRPALDAGFKLER